MMAGTQVLKRIPRIKFPQRHAKSSAGSAPQFQASSGSKSQDHILKSEVPAPPVRKTVGGKASLQPKRTPVSKEEMEAVLGPSFGNQDHRPDGPDCKWERYWNTTYVENPNIKLGGCF